MLYVSLCFYKSCTFIKGKKTKYTTQSVHLFHHFHHQHNFIIFIYFQLHKYKQSKLLTNIYNTTTKVNHNPSPARSPPTCCICLVCGWLPAHYGDSYPNSLCWCELDMYVQYIIHIHLVNKHHFPTIIPFFYCTRCIIGCFDKRKRKLFLRLQ